MCYILVMLLGIQSWANKSLSCPRNADVGRINENVVNSFEGGDKILHDCRFYRLWGWKAMDVFRFIS
jgi:hypothetical protein